MLSVKQLALNPKHQPPHQANAMGAILAGWMGGFARDFTDSLVAPFDLASKSTFLSQIVNFSLPY